MIESNLAIYGTFIVYLILMLAIGYYAYMRTASTSDYFLGGRSLGPWPAALSAGASDMSGWLLLGLPGYAYAAGLESLWLAGGLLLGTWGNWLITAKRLRTYSIVAKDSLTLPEFFANRFQDRSALLQVISAFFILLFFLFYTSSAWSQAVNCSKPCSVSITPPPWSSVRSALSLTLCLAGSSPSPGLTWFKAC